MVLKLFRNNSLTNILKVPVNGIHFVIMNWVKKGEHWMNLVAGLHKSFGNENKKEKVLKQANTKS